ncbi:FirrV-1-A7 [Feldmannia irregularis virus a]|uniref:FirrV-1-A7 n=1 Tax=Feldmannia irregularis virus a TaxID=231992 RepID=Q6XM80_9PHYC|nr:FirrV-1-A7 [Feldmannia irregularis virus a]AAR26831.1 FirrV-1-A7 [Feldmannia irregularis virus a]
MVGLKKHTKKYATRNSPPYSARDFRSGTSKRGNDGNMYVVSPRNVNGIKRWVKKQPSKPSQAGPRNDMYTLEHPTRSGLFTVGRTKHVSPRTGVLSFSAKRRRNSSMKSTPVSESKATKPRGEGPTITRKSSFDKVSVTFKPYYTKPRGDSGWIFWVINEKNFRTPHHGFGSGLLHGQTAKQFVADGYKVYVVKEVPAPWD